MDKTLLGKWTQTDDQSYPGLFFLFLEDRSFEARYDALGIVSSGTWQADEGLIDMDQKKHTFGLVGKYQGYYEIDGNLLRMNLVAAGEHARPTDLQGAVTYLKEEA